MDNVTHALAGALLGAATVRLAARRSGETPTGFRRAAFILGVVTAELPDADLVYSGASLGMGKLGYLLHHRGHTHTVVFAIAGALVAWVLALAVWRSLREPPWSRPLLALSIVGTMSHLLLDYTNSYGVHPFWPVDTRWFYGDAVFIVEPWFWIVALVPLFFIAQRTAWRVVCAVLLLAILAAAWRVDLVDRGTAMTLTAGATVWLVTMRIVAPARRVPLALVGWLALETVFFAAAHVSRRTVRDSVGQPFRDVVLVPSPGNPLCISALAVTEAGGMYRASSATVAPVPWLRAVAGCRPNDRGLPRGEGTAPGTNTPSLRWEGSWSAPIVELRSIAAGNCEASAALRFMRVPIWRRATSGDVLVSDLRFGEGGGSFASVETRPTAACPHPVPNWEWPRRDLLGAAP